jgi:integrator complex subunit 9
VPEFIPPTASGLVDLSTVDAILVSNYNCLLGLPYITEGTGFKGRVFMTEPTMTFGRLFLEETIEYIERSSKGQRASRWKEVCKTLPAPLCEAENPQVRLKTEFVYISLPEGSYGVGVSLL